MRLSAKVLATGAAATVLGAATAIAGIPNFQGADSVGDPYYPKMGNTGYDATSYDFDIVWNRSGRVKAITTMSATADTDEGAGAVGPSLARFNLDFRGPQVTSLTVDGQPATFTRAGQELVITPGAPIVDGQPLEVVTTYRGTPEQVPNPDGSRDGWTETADGVVALGEPQAVPSFVPVNDHPTDKALWHFEISVPRALFGISNGRLEGIERGNGRTTTAWQVDEPMPSYLAIVTIGDYRTDRGNVGGVPYFGAVDGKLRVRDLTRLRKNTGIAMEFMEGIAGPYPFSATGGVIDPSNLGFALENQTRSYYPGPPSRQLVIHEIAHQWYGDSVAVRRWKEIWLNEGFAQYMQWLYVESAGRETAAERFDRLYEIPASNNGFWNPPPADPGGPQDLFANSVYVRGAMALQVLRFEIGDDDFFEVLELWAQENEGGNVDTDDFFGLIEDVTGNPAPSSFDDWLYDPGKPDAP